MSNSELKELTRNQLRGRWWEVISVHLICNTIIVIVNLIIAFILLFIFGREHYEDLNFALNIANYIFYAPIAVGFCYLYLNFIKHENKMKDVIWGFRKIVKAVIAHLLINIIYTIGLILLLLPGLIIGIIFSQVFYSQVFYIIAEDDDISALQAMKKSARIMKGNKFKYIMLNLSFIGWGILGLITLGVGFLWIIPYYNITLANFYRDVSKDITKSKQ